MYKLPTAFAKKNNKLGLKNESTKILCAFNSFKVIILV